MVRVAIACILLAAGLAHAGELTHKSTYTAQSLREQGLASVPALVGQYAKSNQLELDHAKPTVFLVRERLDMPRPGETRAAHFHVKVLDPVWRFAYGPAARAALKTALALNRLQFLTIRRYLTLVFATLVLLLLVVAAWR